MEKNVFKCILVILTFRFIHGQDLPTCSPTRNINIANENFYTLDPSTDEGICINQENSTVVHLATANGKITDQSTLSQITCRVTGKNNKICVLMKFFYYYVIVKRPDTNAYSMLLNKALHTDMTKDGNQAVYNVYPYDLECFTGANSDLALFQAIKTSINGDLFYTVHARTSYCYLFKHSTVGKHTFTVSGKQIEINALMRTDQTGLLTCNEDISSAESITQKSITSLKSDQTTFCVDSTKYILDQIYRSSGANSEKNLPVYCKLVPAGKYCLKVASDFQYATFYQLEGNSRLLVMSHNIATASKYFVNPTANPTRIDIFGIGCSNTGDFTVKVLTLLGYIDPEQSKICIVAKETRTNIKYSYGATNQYRYEFSNCDVNLNGNIDTRKIIPFASNTKSVCISSLITKVVDIKIPGVKIEKFVSYDNHICKLSTPKKVCYYLSSTVKYLILATNDGSSKTILHRLADINSGNAADFIYSPNYYQGDTLCLSKQKIGDKWNEVITKSYVIADDQKSCYIVDEMTSPESIDIPQTNGCSSRSLTLNPSTTKPNTDVRPDQTKCRAIMNFKTPDDTTTLNSMTAGTNIPACFVHTCYELIYSIEISATVPNNLVHKVKACSQGVEKCTEAIGNKFIIYKIIESSGSKLSFFKTKATVPSINFDGTKFIYRSEYYMDEVVCFKDDKLEGDKPDTTFNFKPTDFACSIVRELKSDITVNLDAQSDCKRVIRLLHNTPNPFTTQNDPALLCQNIFNDANMNIHHVTSTLLWTCVSYRCSKMSLFADISQSPRTASYSFQECTDSDEKNSCHVHVGKEAVVKLSSSQNGQFKYLHTINMEEEIPESQYYHKYYDINDVVCFPISKLTSEEQTKLARIKFEGSKKFCVIPQLLTQDLTFELKYSETCKREITLAHTNDAQVRERSQAIPNVCQRFISTDSLVSHIITNDIENAKTCITKMCLSLEIVVNTDETIQNCSTQTCNLATNNIKYFKVSSQYNNKVFYVIIEGEFQRILDPTRSEAFYKTQYYISDIFCFKTDKFMDPESLDTAGVFPIPGGLTCFIINELTNSRTITINTISGCNKEIKLTKTTKPAGENVNDKNENRCISLIEKRVDPTQHFEMNKDDLKFCMSHMCLKPIFYVIRPDVADDFKAKVAYCESEPDICATAVDKFDYVNFNNPITDQSLYVQNTEKRVVSSLANSFAPSPYYKDIAICFENTNLLDPATFDDQNSYNLDNHKCIIFGELSAGSKIRITNLARCQRSIEISPQSVPIASHTRDVDSTICTQFLSPTLTREVHSVSIDVMKKCLTHTCSTIVDKIDVPELNKPFVDAKVTSCPNSNPMYGCLEQGRVYDFIKVTNSYINGQKYFRTYEKNNLENYVQKRSVFYKRQYYKGDVVCFFDQLIAPIAEDRKTDTGIYYEGSRICIISSLLTSDITISYKTTKECPLQITLSNAEPTGIPVSEPVPNLICPEFFTKRSQTKSLAVYTIAKISTCKTKTCSVLIHFVQLLTEGEHYVEKKVTKCQITPDCLSEITHFEALKVKSPFITGHLYLRNGADKSSNIGFYRDKFYQDQYYNDSVVCVHEDFLSTSSSLQSLDAVFKSGDVTCFMVSELTEPITIQIRMFGKCLRNITLINSPDPSSGQATTDPCAILYSTPGGVIPRMKLSVLKECIVSTCSKLDYFVSDSTESSKPYKKYHSCNTKEGDSSCIEDATDYFIAAIQNSAVTGKIYVMRDRGHGFTDNDFDKFYYKSHYYNDEVICVVKNRLTPSVDDSTMITFESDKYVCIIVSLQSETKDITTKTKDNCDRIITLNKNNPRRNQENTNDLKCRHFYVEESKMTVPVMTVEKIIRCLSQTCSKVQSTLESQDGETYSGTKMQIRSTGYGAHSPITSGRKYDLIKLSNSFKKDSFYVTTEEIDKSTPEPSKMFSFGKSIHSKDEISCFPTSLVLNLEEVIKVDGVQSMSKQTCVIGSELSKNLQIRLKVTENCHRNIHFMTVSDVSKDPVHTMDTKCSAFSSDTQGSHNLLIKPKQDFLDCASHTCSSFTNIPIANSQKSCSVSSDKSCLSDEKYAFALVKSPYKAQPFLIMSQDVKKAWITIFSIPINYKSFYFSTDIVCFEKDKLKSVTTNILKYTDAASPTIECFQFEENTKDHLLIFTSDSQTSLKYFGTSDSATEPSPPKKVKIEVFEGGKSNHTLDLAFEFETEFDSTKTDKPFTELTDVEDCVSDDIQKGIMTTYNNESSNGFAFTLNQNPIFKNRVIFMIEGENGCVGYYKSEEKLKPGTVDIGTLNNPLKDLQCLYVVNGQLTITLNSKLNNHFTPSKDEKCMKEDELEKSCKYIHHLSKYITVCYRHRKESKTSSNRKSNSNSAIYIMLKHKNCYHHKVTFWQRVGFCQVTSKEILISLFDWDMIKDYEWKINTVSAANIGGGVSIGAAFFVIALALMYYMGRQSKSAVVLDPASTSPAYRC